MLVCLSVNVCLFVYLSYSGKEGWVPAIYLKKIGARRNRGKKNPLATTPDRVQPHENNYQQGLRSF